VQGAEALRSKLVRELQQQGITDRRVLDAIAQLPREHFVEEEYRPNAYRNAPLPIGQGQTISQPFVVALMLQELRLSGSERVLEIGTGSGYQAALLALLVREVVSIERFEALASLARQRIEQLGYRNVEIHVANGTLGWPARAPYDGIVVSAAAPHLPTQLLEQLAEGGRLVIPVGSLTAQELVVVTRRGSTFERQERGGVRFVPLIGEEGWGGQESRG
jgi:protein-L-isoaspartate(D-aspartate) O-methyltransferase